MKIIHTSDWHIGKIVNEFSMIDDQKYILQQLLELIDKEKPTALIIAGDVYDRSIPPVEAVELLNDTLSTLVIDKNVKVLAISGNHDSGERLSFGNKILLFWNSVTCISRQWCNQFLESRCKCYEYQNRRYFRNSCS